MNKHKKFIKDAYEGKYGTMCQDWKNTILEHYPEFGKKLEVGKWYRSTNYDDVIIMVCEPDGNKVKSYGFSDGGWFDHRNKKDHWGYMDETDWRKATPKEVEEQLIEEAKKRGLDKNVFKPIRKTAQPKILNIDTWSYKQERDELFTADKGNGGCVVYSKGKWAEIIKTMTKEEAEKKLGCKIV